MKTEKIKVLLVEDEDVTSRVMQKMIKNLGYKICAAVKSGEEAINVVSLLYPNIILMDIQLKDSFDGIKTASIIKANCNIPVIFITDHDDKETLNRAKTTDPFGFIIKPVSERGLYTAIEIAIYRHRIAQELEMSKQELRALSARLESIREEEKLIIAREIHDELGQTLTCMKIDSIWLAKKLDEGELKNKAISIIDSINSTINTVRKISSGLRTPVLDKLGLFSAIEWQSKEFENRTGIKCILDIPEEQIEVIHPEKAIAIFRIFQECLINAAKHSGAKEIEIIIRNSFSSLDMTISDNGKGFIGNSKKQNSFGIIGMKERAIIFGGKVSVDSIKGKGVTVTIQFPVIQSMDNNRNEGNNHRRPQSSKMRA